MKKLRNISIHGKIRTKTKKMKYATSRINMSTMKGHLSSQAHPAIEGKNGNKFVLWFLLLERRTHGGLFATLEIGIRFLL